MSQSNVKKLVSELRIKVGPRRRFSNPEGPEGRLLKMRKMVTGLIKYERIEMNYHLADESRGYAERLISDAIRYGEHHNETMEMASYWLTEKQLVHKLFKVLVPRFKDCKESYTQLWAAPRTLPSRRPDKCLLELRDNIYPKLNKEFNNSKLLHNVLLQAAREEFMKEQEAKKIDSPPENSEDSENIVCKETETDSNNETAVNTEGKSNEDAEINTETEKNTESAPKTEEKKET